MVERLNGEPGLTPRLDELIREADWAGPAIASSSWEGSTMATLFTGLRPWQHQVLHPGHARLSPDLITLAEAMKTAGYDTAGYFSGPWYDQSFGFNQGFGSFQHYGKGVRLLDRMREMDNGRRFLWAHLPAPQAPYIRRDAYLRRLGRVTPQIPRKVMPMQLEPYFDPANPLPLSQRRRLWAAYCLNVAWADDQLGQLLDALRASGAWDRTLLVVTANHGEEFGEKGQILHGGNLGRQLIEVPLVIKLPAGSARRILVPRRSRVPAARLWATLVEAAGGQVPPAAAPSLFRRAPLQALSELYLTNGTNRFSLVDGDDQLLWESRFAPSEPEYYLARYGFRSKEARSRMKEEPRAVFGRLRTAFAVVPPLHGKSTIGPPRLTLERWGVRGSRPADLQEDPAARERIRTLAADLARNWSAFVPEENAPGQESREWTGMAGGEKAGQNEKKKSGDRKRERP